MNSSNFSKHWLPIIVKACAVGVVFMAVLMLLASFVSSKWRIREFNQVLLIRESELDKTLTTRSIARIWLNSKISLEAKNKKNDSTEVPISVNIRFVNEVGLHSTCNKVYAISLKAGGQPNVTRFLEERFWDGPLADAKLYDFGTLDLLTAHANLLLILLSGFKMFQMVNYIVVGLLPFNGWLASSTLLDVAMTELLPVGTVHKGKVEQFSPTKDTFGIGFAAWHVATWFLFLGTGLVAFHNHLLYRAQVEEELQRQLQQLQQELLLKLEEKPQVEEPPGTSSP